jgi:hypothetical protein
MDQTDSEEKVKEAKECDAEGIHDMIQTRKEGRGLLLSMV